MKYIDSSIQIFEDENSERSYWNKNKTSFSNNVELYKNVYQNDYASIPIDEAIKDINDSIVENKLIEHEGDSDYYLHNNNKELFDLKKYIDDQNIEGNKKRFRFVLKVPSRLIILNENEFHVLIRLFKTDNFVSENTIVKLLSDSFYFSESIIQLTEQEKEIKLTKRTPCMNYIIRIKIYYNNEVVEDKKIDIYERK